MATIGRAPCHIQFATCHILHCSPRSTRGLRATHESFTSAFPALRLSPSQGLSRLNALAAPRLPRGSLHPRLSPPEALSARMRSPNATPAPRLFVRPSQRMPPRLIKRAPSSSRAPHLAPLHCSPRPSPHCHDQVVARDSRGCNADCTRPDPPTWPDLARIECTTGRPIYGMHDSCLVTERRVDKMNLHSSCSFRRPSPSVPVAPAKHTTVTHDRNVIVPSKRDRNHALISEGLRAFWCEMNIAVPCPAKFALSLCKELTGRCRGTAGIN